MQWCKNFEVFSKKFVLASALLVGYVEVGHSYTVPDKYKCKTPGYYRVVTDPIDASSSYSGTVTHYELPPNVCVRRLPNFLSKTDWPENFAKEDFIKIVGRNLVPFNSVTFVAQDYEPILGHYLEANRNYAGSTESRSPDLGNFSGKHPVLVKKKAYAALRYDAIKGEYLFDKQNVVLYFSPDNPRCPAGYSTVGGSSTCYSKANGLKLNTSRKLELQDISGFIGLQDSQECPVGMAMAAGLGSDKGICTSFEALHRGIAKTELWLPGRAPTSGVCPGGEFWINSICLPQLTAIHCSGMQYAFYWPTSIVNYANARINLNENYHMITHGTVDIKHLRSSYALVNGDDGFITLSGVEDGSLPALHLFSGRNCGMLMDNGTGWTTEPFPSAW